MKIFPPVTQMIWSKNQTIRQNLWSRRYSLALATIACCLTAWSVVQSTTYQLATARPVAIDPSACSALLNFPLATNATLYPCSPFKLSAGASVEADRPLMRTNLPPRSYALTAADQAIVPPETLRSSVFDGSNAASEATDKRSIALSPARQ